MSTGPVIVLLHGVGSRGADLEPLATYLEAQIPGARVLTPDGTEPFDQGGSGRQWFSVSGVTEANRPGRVVAARAALDRMLNQLLNAEGVGNDLSRVALVGFSQGAIMALDAVASGRWPVRAVVAMAGRLASPAPLAPAQDTKVLLLHGEADGVMPVPLATEARDALTASGIEVGLQTFPGLGHGISAEVAETAGRFLAKAYRADASN